MKRSDYLKLCVSAAMLTYRKPKVLYAGIEYYPEGYEMRFDKSGKAIPYGNFAATARRKTAFSTAH